MKQRPKGLIEEFTTKDTASVFQLIRESPWVYVIKRDKKVLLRLRDKAKALKGFKSLKEKWSA